VKKRYFFLRLAAAIFLVLPVTPFAWLQERLTDECQWFEDWIDYLAERLPK